jgi:pimeloyl-ACP methyl ester carboxylesterase
LTPARELEAPAAFVKIMQGMTSSNFSPNIRKLLPQMQIPMLLLWGGEDRMIPPQTANVLLKLNPLIELVQLEGAGHCAHDEIPAVVNQSILLWIDTLATGSCRLTAGIESRSEPNPRSDDPPYALPLGDIS